MRAVLAGVRKRRGSTCDSSRCASSFSLQHKLCVPPSRRASSAPPSSVGVPPPTNTVDASGTCREYALGQLEFGEQRVDVAPRPRVCRLREVGVEVAVPQIEAQYGTCRYRPERSFGQRRERLLRQASHQQAQVRRRQPGHRPSVGRSVR